MTFAYTTAAPGADLATKKKKKKKIHHTDLEIIHTYKTGLNQGPVIFINTSMLKSYPSGTSTRIFWDA